jgi:hypothetical protein
VTILEKFIQVTPTTKDWVDKLSKKREKDSKRKQSVGYKRKRAQAKETQQKKQNTEKNEYKGCRTEGVRYCSCKGGKKSPCSTGHCACRKLLEGCNALCFCSKAGGCCSNLFKQQ